MSPSSDNTLVDPHQVIADLQRANDALRRRLDERTAERDALRHELADAGVQQTATAEVLQVINSSHGDLAPVFDAVLEKAVSLSEAVCGHLWRFDGEHFHPWRSHGDLQFARWFEHLGPVRPNPDGDGFLGRVLRGEGVLYIADVRDTQAYRAGNAPVTALADIGGGRSVLTVALRKDDAVLGVLTVYRREVKQFSAKQISLLQNFAAQAVIAMENARLLTETREALDQQTGTAEVLKAISRSTFDLRAVLQTVVSAAHRLCQSDYSVIFRQEGDEYRWAAGHGISAEYEERERRAVIRPGTGTVIGRAVLAGHAVQIADAKADPLYQGEAESDAHAMLGVPLLRDGVAIGGIGLARNRVETFTDKQVELVTIFADQAVIAIENARLITETREALEQQTATAEVLQVINSSPGDLTPVFAAMLEKATRLCEGTQGVLWTYDGERFRPAAMFGVSAEFVVEMERAGRPGPLTPMGRIAGGERLVQIVDLAADESYRAGEPVPRVAVEIGGFRSLVAVALVKDEALLGAFIVSRREVRAFTDKQIALLQNFAAQAVIAMENARLLGELRERTSDLEESLEYQTATSDVLKVISRSTFYLQPVLQTVLDTAVRLCRAGPSEIFRMEGDGYRFAVGHGMTPEYEALERTVVIHPDPGTLVGRTALERRAVHVLDAWTDPLYSQKEEARIGNFHTMLGVPLMREGEVAGVIALSRRMVEPFSEREMQLVTTFADQAVIAIENMRLLTELREALDQQTATAEILQVINSSPGDLRPVFDIILNKTHNLCGASRGALFLFDGETFRAAAAHGYPEDFAERLRQGISGPIFTPLIAGARLIHYPDLTLIDDPLARSVAERGGVRTNLLLPLSKDGALLGMISCNRGEVRPFSDKEIALLENFAAQAVIGMENARLLNEIRQRQAELRVTFDNMGDGVAMFDSELRLAAWNRNFQETLDLPDTFLAERPSFAEYFRYLAARGEYGSADLEAELSRAVEDPGRDMRLERTRPDGRVIEVRRNAVPGGGFVLIYGDVTERQRAEAEIRAARDTAEKALQELQTAQASLLHAQKMAALGQLTAGIAHEIKNPLNFVNNFAELSGELLLELKETTAPVVAALGDDERAAVDEVVEMLRGNLDKIAEHGKRADGIVKSMLEHSRGVSGERRVVDLNALIEEALNLAYHGARAQDASFNITLEREFDRGLAPTELAPQELTRVFLNLFGNSFYATTKRQRAGAGPDFRPALKVATRELGDAVEVRVRDNGTGISPEIRDKLFQPFVTTKPTGEGTGLGLSIAYDIVTQQHGGTIAVDSRVGEFTEFTIRLPRAHRTIAEAAL